MMNSEIYLIVKIALLQYFLNILINSLHYYIIYKLHFLLLILSFYQDYSTYLKMMRDKRLLIAYKESHNLTCILYRTKQNCTIWDRMLTFSFWKLKVQPLKYPDRVFKM